MPRFLDPDSTFKVVLDSDMDKTPTPTFIVKSVSMREHLAIVDALTTQTQSENTVKGVYEIAISKLKKLVVGWSGMVVDGQEIPYSPDRLEDLEYKEAVELLNKVGRGTHVDTEQKKS